MEKIHTYSQYSDILAAFKKDKARCNTNKLLMRDELTELIDSGKLYYDEIDDVLWFFVNEGYFYSASFYVSTGTPLKMRKQDLDVMVELTGNQDRYNDKWEQELIAAGYEKGDKRIEWSAQIDDIIDEVRSQLEIRCPRLEKQGMFFRKATKADYTELGNLWEMRFGKSRYVLTAMTDAEWKEIEQFGRCDVICDADGKIVAVYVYSKRNKTACAFHVEALYQGQGLGSAILYRLIISAFEEGCTKFTCWIREDNQESIWMHQHVLTASNKFYRQYICKAEVSK